MSKSILGKVSVGFDYIIDADEESTFMAAGIRGMLEDLHREGYLSLKPVEVETWYDRKKVGECKETYNVRVELDD